MIPIIGKTVHKHRYKMIKTISVHMMRSIYNVQYSPTKPRTGTKQDERGKSKRQGSGRGMDKVYIVNENETSTDYHIIVQQGHKAGRNFDQRLEPPLFVLVLIAPPLRVIVIVYSRSGSPSAGMGYHHLRVWPSRVHVPSEVLTDSASGEANDDDVSVVLERHEASIVDGKSHEDGLHEGWLVVYGLVVCERDETTISSSSIDSDCPSPEARATTLSLAKWTRGI